MVYTRQTRGPVDAVVQRLTEATKANQFGVLGTINLKA